MRRGMQLTAVLLAALSYCETTAARTLTWVRAADSVTLDPHATNEGAAHTLSHQIYEPLILRDSQGKAQPALAESWTITSDPKVWEFKLRQGVTFHDGAPFSADDVIFSIDRARQPASEMRPMLTSVDRVTKVDNFTVRISTKGAAPLLPGNLTSLFIMSKVWTEQNRATKIHNVRSNEDSFVGRAANGTGPFALVSREPEIRTVLRRNENYWGRDQIANDIAEIVVRPVPSDTDRVAALLSGEADLVQDIPVQDLQRLQAAPNIRVNVGAENRSIFIGLNVGDPELKSSDIRGRNPFADLRVRQAINLAVDQQAIQKTVMRGQSIPDWHHRAARGQRLHAQH